jgi:hypothetical protein
MRKALGSFVSRKPRIASCAMPALVLVAMFTPVAARADSFTQTFTQTANDASGIVVNFVPFNPALGTLQSLTFQLEGKSTITEQQTFPYTLTITLEDPFAAPLSAACDVAPAQTTACSLQTAPFVDTNAADLALAESLPVISFSSLFSTTPTVTLGADSVDFSLVYTYAPAVVSTTPEPGTTGLLVAGVGLLALISLTRKRISLAR